MQYSESLLRLVNADVLASDRVVAALKRQIQIDDVAEWYDQYNPLPMLQELAAHELKQAVETTALSAMTDQEYAAFRRQWHQLPEEEQRSFLYKLSGLQPKLHEGGEDAA